MAKTIHPASGHFVFVFLHPERKWTRVIPPVKETLNLKDQKTTKGESFTFEPTGKCLLLYFHFINFIYKEDT